MCAFVHAFVCVCLCVVHRSTSASLTIQSPCTPLVRWDAWQDSLPLWVASAASSHARWLKTCKTRWGKWCTIKMYNISHPAGVRASLRASFRLPNLGTWVRTFLSPSNNHPSRAHATRVEHSRRNFVILRKIGMTCGGGKKQVRKGLARRKITQRSVSTTS